MLYAAKFGRNKCLRVLLEYGADVNQEYAMNDSQRQNKNQSQIQRNNFLIQGNITGIQHKGGPSRDGSNNNDMRSGTGTIPNSTLSKWP